MLGLNQGLVKSYCVQVEIGGRRIEYPGRRLVIHSKAEADWPAVATKLQVHRWRKRSPLLPLTETSVHR